ncbi:PTS sugar transporter subunit IIC [Tepidimicrobium xylanilyticum]|uniref:Permease IIC component n=1 Tax=Tepidimicrobium xylanilyticum TaxID=1123352 RepID=A0A1H3DAF4_9FIRM|nr:PTS sugar transporter subunit IIC [Tepidimicrobium xylanilyticum]GMG97934.1 permease IIC component [Tepidimicrobium xylanilyticum]SDX62659.1 PTS system, cellobiose-specific IIC component [Tepidimicrobium xylanilyticum]
MDRFMDFMERKFVPVAAKIGGQRHLVAIRDGFVAIMPLILAGSTAVLLKNTIFSWIASLEVLIPICDQVWWGSLAIMTLLVVFSTAYSLARSYDANALASGLIAVGSYFATLPQSHGDAGWGYIHWGYLQATGLFTGLIVAIIATEIFVRLTKRDLTIKMPEEVPPAVGRAFAAVIPGMITIFTFGIVFLIVDNLGGISLYDVIYEGIQKPLQGFSQGVGSAMVMAMLINLFWFFGLHGANIFDPIMNALYLPALTDNAAAIDAGMQAPNVITRVFFDTYVHLGGSGATLGLIIAIFIASKRRKEYREVAKLSTPSGIFQINEPIMFGLPIVLNPILFIPFIITPGILTLIAYIGTAIGFAPPTYVAIPWTSPPIVGAFLATGATAASWRAAVLAAINLVVSVIIYLPFIKLADRSRKKETAK